MRIRRISGLAAAVPAVLGAMVLGAAVLGSAPARADDFPNLDSYAAVAPDKYFVTTEQATVRSIQFTTPEGIGCMFRASENMSPTSRQRLTCDGPIPGLPSDAQTVASVPGVGPAIPGVGCPMGTVAQKGDGAFELSKGTWSCGTKPDAPLLDVGQKIAYGNVTCAVGGGGLTACQVAVGDQKHGFLLQPSGSRGF